MLRGKNIKSLNSAPQTVLLPIKFQHKHFAFLIQRSDQLMQHLREGKQISKG